MFLGIPITFRITGPYLSETWYLRHDTRAHLSGFHQSVSLYVFILVVARHLLRRHVPAAKNTRQNRTIMGSGTKFLVFFVVPFYLQSVPVHSADCVQLIH
jgi:cytochrome b561